MLGTIINRKELVVQSKSEIIHAPSLDHSIVKVELPTNLMKHQVIQCLIYDKIRMITIDSCRFCIVHTLMTITNIHEMKVPLNS